MKNTILLALPFFLLFDAASLAAKSEFAIAEQPFLQSETSLDLYCLRVSYEAIKTANRDSQGRIWLEFGDGRKVPYEDPAKAADGLAVDVKGSLAQPYPLEPDRPVMPPGFAPGRKRSYELLEALYGQDAKSVMRNLRIQTFMHKRLRFAPDAASAFAKAVNGLDPLKKEKRQWLVPEGAFYWRKIAGEGVLSAHSYGIAVDLGVKKAPYWRWSKIIPHPLQKSYPTDIVDAFEKQGFIWGGKWREYDLMHFEYRPEIICKARMRRCQGANGAHWQ